jgi:hypothetical protein
MNVKEQKQLHDTQVQEIYDILAPYQAAHTNAQIDVRRRHEVSIHIRIIDPDFHGMRWAEREDRLWPLLHQLSYETLSDITILLLLTPGEAPKSMANMEFENPVTWPLEEDSLLVAADN